MVKQDEEKVDTSDPFYIYNQIRQELINSNYVREKDDEVFFGIRRSVHSDWRGWNRLDELKSHHTSQDQFRNDGQLSMDALNFIYDSYTRLNLNTVPYEQARETFLAFLSLSSLEKTSQSNPSPQTVQPIGGRKWSKPKK